MTVIYPDQGPGYCSVEDVRALGITEDMASATTIEVNINRAAQEMDAYLGGSYMMHDIAEWMDGNGRTKLFLKDYPIKALQAVRLRKSDGSIEDLSIFDPDTNPSGIIRIANAEAGIIERIDGGVFPRGHANIYISWTAGYLKEDIPGALKMVNARLAAAYTLMGIEGAQNPNGLNSISEGALNVSFGAHSSKVQALTDGWKDALKAYKRLAYGTL